MNGMTEEEFRALAFARGWTAPPAASAQPTQPVTTAPPTATAPALPALPTQTNQPTRRPSAPRRPLAATRPSSLSRLDPSTQPTIPALSAAPIPYTMPASSAPLPPNPLPAPFQPIIPAQSVIPTPSAAPVQATMPTHSIGPDRPTGRARAARQAASDAHLATAGSTRRIRPPTGAGAPPPRKLSTLELADLHFELSQLLDEIDPFEVRFAIYPGGRKTKVDVKGRLGLSDETFRVIRKIIRATLRRTPGIDMTQTITNQGSNYLIMRAIQYALPFLPGFEIYKDYDYWPLECIASKLFRNSANTTQSKKREKAKANPQPGDKAKDGSGYESEVEYEAAPTVEQAIESQVNPSREIRVPSARLEAQSPFNPNAPIAPGALAARPVHVVPTLIDDNVVTNMTHDLGNMSVDPVWEQVADQEATEPFALPPELTGAASTQPPALAPPALAPPAPIPFTPVRVTSQPSSAVATMVVSNPLVAHQTPARKPPVENAITPGLFQRLWKLRDADLTDAQINHFPAATRAAILAMRNLKPDDTPLDANAALAALPISDSTSHQLEDEVDGASSGLSEPEQSVTEHEADLEDIEVDEGKGTAAGGRKSGRGTGKSVRGKKQATPAASGSGRATRSKANSGTSAGQGDKPKRAGKQTAAQRASGSVQTTSAPDKPKTTQTTTTKKKKK